MRSPCDPGAAGPRELTRFSLHGTIRCPASCASWQPTGVIGLRWEPGENMLLTKHEGETFINQTVYISGQAFIRCNFVACTLVLRETVYHLEGCAFERCNWHVDWVLMWGSPESLREIKALVAMIEQAQQQQLPSDPLRGAQQAQPNQPQIRQSVAAPPISGVKPKGEKAEK